MQITRFFVLLLSATAPLATHPVAISCQDVPLYEFRTNVSVHDGALSSGLGPVTFVAAGPDGKLAVAQPREGHVLILSSDGHLLGVVGGPGEDIGNFMSMLRVGWLADTLWVADQRLFRLTLFPMGKTQPSTLIRNFGSVRRPGSPQSVPVPTPDGGEFFLREAASVEGLGTQSIELVAWTPTAGLATLAVIRRANTVLVDYPGGVTKNVGADPFSDHPLFSLAPDGSHVIVVRRDRTGTDRSPAFSVTRINMTGDTLLHFEREFTPHRVTDSTRARIVETHMARGFAREFEDIPTARRAITSALSFPESHPPVSALEIGTDGMIWLRGIDDWTGPVDWEVLDSSGRHLYTVQGDRRIESLVPTRDGVWAISYDDLVGPLITKYTLERVGPSSSRSVPTQR
jgi:hypothetical protein